MLLGRTGPLCRFDVGVCSLKGAVGLEDRTTIVHDLRCSTTAALRPVTTPLVRRPRRRRVRPVLKNELHGYVRRLGRPIGLE